MGQGGGLVEQPRLKKRDLRKGKEQCTIHTFESCCEDATKTDSLSRLLCIHSHTCWLIATTTVNVKSYD